MMYNHIVSLNGLLSSDARSLPAFWLTSRCQWQVADVFKTICGRLESAMNFHSKLKSD